jgi:hypothetical protein
MKNKNGLRERDFYKITDKMWKEIEKWSEGHNVELKFDWDFESIAIFLTVRDQNTEAYIDFCDGKVQKKIDIPKDRKTVEIDVLPINDIVWDKKSFNILYYEDKKIETMKFIDDIKQKIINGEFNGEDSDFIRNKLEVSPAIIRVRENYQGEGARIELR